jgi:broad-specificity NMP kinase
MNTDERRRMRERERAEVEEDKVIHAHPVHTRDLLTVDLVLVLRLQWHH